MFYSSFTTGLANCKFFNDLLKNDMTLFLYIYSHGLCCKVSSVISYVITYQKTVSVTNHRHWETSFKNVPLHKASLFSLFTPQVNLIYAGDIYDTFLYTVHYYYRNCKYYSNFIHFDLPFAVRIVRAPVIAFLNHSLLHVCFVDQ